MNKIIFIFSALLLFSCDQTKNKNSFALVKGENTPKNEIVLIFEKNDQNTSITKDYSLLGENIYYTEKGDFIINELKPKNNLYSDTLAIPVIADKICLTHIYHKIKSNVYEFQKGDTIIFKYDKGKPSVSVLNQDLLKFNYNIYNDSKIKKPLGLFDFAIKNKRLRNKNEEEVYLTELKNYTIETNRFLDSIFKKDLISKSVNKMYKGYNHFFEINANPNLLIDVKEKDLKIDELLYLKTYRYFLNKYVVFKFKLKTKFVNDPMSVNSKTAFDSVAKSFIFSKRVKESLHIRNYSKFMEYFLYLNKFR